MEASSSLSPLSSPSEITQTWLENMLKIKFHMSVKVTTWSMKKPETKNGYLSEICFVKVSFFMCGDGTEEKEEERALVVKFLPQNEMMLKTMENSSLGEREIGFYKHTLTEEFKLFCENSGLRHPVPEVYLAEFRDNKLSLVLQDLSNAGFKLSVPIEGNSVKQIKSALAAIAVIHASGIATIRNHGKHPVGIPLSFLSWSDFLVNALNMQMKIFEGTPIKDIVKSILSLSRELLTVEEKYPFVDTVIHGDLWAANVMFSQDDQEVSIIDWQFARIGNLVCDIVSLLLLSGAPHTYNEHLTEVLECYWQNFENSMKKNGIPVDITFQDLVRNVESMWIYGYMFFILSITDSLGNQIDVNRVKAAVHFLEKRGVFKKFLS